MPKILVDDDPDLQLPEQALSAVAIVRHSSQVRSGFEFLGLTAGERGQITAVCARQQALQRSRH
jgi:hypothetical protein